MQYNKRLDESENIDIYYKNIILDAIHKFNYSEQHTKIDEYILVYAIQNKLFDAEFICNNYEIFGTIMILQYEERINKLDFINKIGIFSIKCPSYINILVIKYIISNFEKLNVTYDNISTIICNVSRIMSSPLYNKTYYNTYANNFAYLINENIFNYLNEKAKFYICIGKIEKDYRQINPYYRLADRKLIYPKESDTIRKLIKYVLYINNNIELNTIYEYMKFLDVNIYLDETTCCGLWQKTKPVYMLLQETVSNSNKMK